MSSRFSRWFVALLAFAAFNAGAATIFYESTALGGNQWRYDYVVLNDGSIAAEINLFDILFEPALYGPGSLSIVSDPVLTAGWDQVLLAPGISVPPAFDALAMEDGVSIGGYASGFAVTFSWLGTGLPGAQSFEIYNPNTFALLGTGTTTTVPLPASLSLFAAGLIAAGRYVRRKPAGSMTASDVPVGRGMASYRSLWHDIA